MLFARQHHSVGEKLISDDTVVGLIINIRNCHWTCVCKESGRVFYVDSMTGRPVLIDESNWLRILELHPDAFLVVTADSDH